MQEQYTDEEPLIVLWLSFRRGILDFCKASEYPLRCLMWEESRDTTDAKVAV